MDPFANPYYAPFMAAYSNVNPFSPVSAGLANTSPYAYGAQAQPWNQNMAPGMQPCASMPCQMPGVGGATAVGLGRSPPPEADPNRALPAGMFPTNGVSPYGSVYPPYGGPLRVGPPMEMGAPPPGAAIGEGTYTKDFPQFREVPPLDSHSTVMESSMIEHDHSIYALIDKLYDAWKPAPENAHSNTERGKTTPISFAEMSAGVTLPPVPPERSQAFLASMAADV